MSSEGDSTSKYKEQFIKKKLHGFLNDLLRFGCAKGFRYFDTYLRGREELLLKVQNEQSCSGYHPLGRCESQGIECEETSSTDSFPSRQGLPRNRLSGFQFLAIGLPPASPCSSEISPVDQHTTIFLIASYARYKSPYVWVRTNHDRLIRLSDVDSSEQSVVKDSPLKLRTILDWSTKDIKIWDIISEIVRVNVQPQPRNPFAIDHSYFDTLPPEECILASGAMIHILQKILEKERSYNSLISADLNELTKLHFKELQAWSCTSMTPRSRIVDEPSESYNKNQYSNESRGFQGSAAPFYR
eukprot:gene16944-8434_t